MSSPGSPSLNQEEGVDAIERFLGRSTDVLDTPALIVDLDLMERNIARIATRCQAAKLAWRPHCKTHKSGDVARLLLAAGAIGVTCAKLSEAVAMADAGVEDILIANQIAGALKIDRLIQLRQRVDVAVAVDHPDNIAALAAVAATAGVVLRVLIEVDTGTRRAGVLPGAPVVELARLINGYRSLRLAGLMTWEGHTTTIADPGDKRRAITEALTALTGSAELCRRAGFAIEIVSCGGTGTYDIAADVSGITEIQAGGGIFGDVRYRDLYHVDLDFALTVLSTVTSRPNPRRIICDAGKKALSTDAGMPMPLALPALASIGFSAEHGKLELVEDAKRPAVGERIQIVPGYADTTVHLHRTLFGVRRGVIETVWPIAPEARLH